MAESESTGSAFAVGTIGLFMKLVESLMKLSSGRLEDPKIKEGTAP